MAEEEEAEDFEHKEIDHDVVISEFINRLTCFSHLLQLVLRKFDEVVSYCPVLQNVRTLIKTSEHVDKSYGATHHFLWKEVGQRLFCKVELHLPCDREATSAEIFACYSTQRARVG